MTNDAVIVMQLVLGISIVLTGGVSLHAASRRLDGRTDLALLVGYYLLGGGGLAMVGVTGNPQSELILTVLGLKLGFVAIVSGIGYLACLAALNKNHDRREALALARRRIGQELLG